MINERPGIDYKVGANMNAWADRLLESAPALSSALKESREVGFQGLRELNLPRTDRLIMPVDDFLVFPDKFTELLDSDKFAVNLLPQKEEFKRYAKPNLTPEQTVNFIHESIPDEHIAEYNISLLPYWPTLYGGSVLIDTDGSIGLEFREGDPGPIAYGNEVPQYVATRDPFIRTFHYAFEDQGVRQRAYQTIMAIPHTGKGREMEFPAGYYEFVWNQLKSGEERIFFIDYRSNPAYRETLAEAERAEQGSRLSGD